MSDKGIVAELYSDEAFWEKLGKHGAEAGAGVLDKALVLYYTLKGPKTPVRIRAAIMGALAYFVMPLDAIPDTLLGVGYLDDLGVLVWAYDTTFKHIDSSAVANAARTVQKWLAVPVAAVPDTHMTA
jgi:uncharacterized membrane protein YkvA (DUF1232 family)